MCGVQIIIVSGSSSARTEEGFGEVMLGLGGMRSFEKVKRSA